MKTFVCHHCGSLVFFENTKCLKCNHALGFLPSMLDFMALEPVEGGFCRAATPDQTDQTFRSCNNRQEYEACNWMVEAGESDQFCISCRLNEMIPNLSVPGNLDQWRKLEMAKRRVIYTILKLGLPLGGMPGANRPALRFKFVSQVDGGPAQLTGHLNGLITVNIAEADDAERERRRVNLHEPYRTPLGHLRHEVAHYYWDILIADSNRLTGFRNVFGDETADYANALKQYYQQGPPSDWQARYVSAYASVHPWEDWAESWAHYFHIIDMVETAASFGMILRPKHPEAGSMSACPPNPADATMDFGAVLEYWFPLTYALNSLNRGMGLSDAYPFAVATPAVEKMRFIHDVVRAASAGKYGD